MTEKERVSNNNNGELPQGDYDIVKVKGIPNPEDELNTFKQTVITFLDNKTLDAEDPKWEELLPEKLVKFTNQLEEENYHDQVLSNIPNIIDGLQDIRKWEWYSSKLLPDGFEVVMKGIFRAIFQPIIHHQGIPQKSISTIREGKEYPIIRSGIDVLLYRNWNPETYELSPRTEDWETIRAPFMPK